MSNRSVVIDSLDPSPHTKTEQARNSMQPYSIYHISQYAFPSGVPTETVATGSYRINYTIEKTGSIWGCGVCMDWSWSVDKEYGPIQCLEIILGGLWTKTGCWPSPGGLDTTGSIM